MHEMGVYDVRALSTDETCEQEGIEVARGRNPDRRHAQRPVEVVRVPRRIVETDEYRLDPALRERGQQREQVSLRAADAADPMDVEDSHRRNAVQARSIVAAASTAIRKSQATR